MEVPQSATCIPKKAFRIGSMAVYSDWVGKPSAVPGIVITLLKMQNDNILLHLSNCCEEQAEAFSVGPYQMKSVYNFSSFCFAYLFSEMKTRVAC